MPNICIFCASKKGNSEKITNNIVEFCEIISKAGFDLVYGGSNFGMIGLVASIFKKTTRK